MEEGNARVFPFVLQLRIYIVRALQNLGVVVSHTSTRKGAATIVTKQSIASSKVVCQGCSFLS